MRLQRLPNPLRGMRREHKIMLGVGAGAVLLFGTIATVAWAAESDPPPPKRAIEVGPGCTSYAIVSEQQLRDDLRSRLRMAAQQTGTIDPFQVTARYIRVEAPTCPTYPAKTQSPTQVKLFAEVFLELLELMQQEDYMAAADFPTWYQMMSIWATGQGVNIEEL